MQAARKLYVPEDAADGCWVECPYEDAMDDAISLEDVEPPSPWRCEMCAQLWPAEEFACGYCGTEREE